MTPAVEDPFARVRALATELGATLVDQGGAFEIHFARPPLRLRVTVAPEVLEWFLDVDDDTSGRRFRDYGDYSGYDARAHAALAAEMVAHLHCLLPVLAQGEFRLVPSGPWFCPTDRLEWRPHGPWIEFDYGDVLEP